MSSGEKLSQLFLRFTVLICMRSKLSSNIRESSELQRGETTGNAVDEQDSGA